MLLILVYLIMCVFHHVLAFPHIAGDKPMMPLKLVGRLRRIEKPAANLTFDLAAQLGDGLYIGAARSAQVDQTYVG